jgi:gamma-glutamyltranspeptidase / glutathione hydrolase
MRRRTWSLALVLVLVFGCAPQSDPPATFPAPTPSQVGAPGPTPAPDLEKRAVGENGMVAAAHPLASEAGVELLRQGGNAVDAAIAVGFALNVVEPMMSGVGGGGSMLIWLQDEQRAEYLDFYSAAPASAWLRALPDTGSANLRGVGVPGAAAGFLEAHERFGVLPLRDVMAPAIRLAEEGFPVYPVLAAAIESSSEKLEMFPESARRFLPGGEPLAVGETLRQPELAETLRRIVADGRDGFYRGETARRVVAAVNAGGSPVNEEEFAAYSPQWDKRPVCTVYRGRVVLSGAPPQTGMRVLHALNLLEPHDLQAMGLPTRSPEAFHVLASALRVAAADHSRHNNDPNWVEVPAAGVTSKAFARERASLVGGPTVPEQVAGADAHPFDASPPADACAALDPYGPARTVDTWEGIEGMSVNEETTEGETTHTSVVDMHGNAVSLTNTLSPFFGSGAWVEGFFLNSSAVNFEDLDPRAEARSEWRVRSSTISPTIVLEDGSVRLIIGTPGGGRIPGAIVQGLVYVLDYGLDPLEAVRMPRILAPAGNRRIEVEQGFSGEVIGRVRALGYDPVLPSPGYARLYAVARVGNVWVGAADPRHDGGARGY